MQGDGGMSAKTMSPLEHGFITALALYAIEVVGRDEDKFPRRWVEWMAENRDQMPDDISMEGAIDAAIASLEGQS